MKNRYLVIVTMSFIFLTYSYSEEKKWKLVWQDNFFSIDTTCWSKIRHGHGEWDKFMNDTTKCYRLLKNKIRLYGLKCDSTYYTGGLWTKGKRTFREGRIEIRARFNNTTGAWPAIWLLAENTKWPKGGEIDIMEHLNGDGFVYQTLHNSFLQGKGDGPYNQAKGRIKKGKYNIYAVEFDSACVNFFVNSKKTLTYYKNGKDEQFPYGDNEYILILSMQLGGRWVGEIKDETLPAFMDVDWVKYYIKQ